VLLHTADSPDKVVTVYRDELKKNGWESKSADVSKSTQLRGKKGNRTLTIIVSVEAGKTSITVVVPAKK
jgi:hypothetical protein